MSKDPTPNPPPKAGVPETLEDAIYKPSLSEGNRSVAGANPLVSGLLSIVSYCLIAGSAWFVATQTKVGKQIVKTATGVDLVEEGQKEEELPPPPPPPPPAPAVAAPVVKVEVKDAPPPPPPDPGREIVPEVAPREMPQRDMSLVGAVHGDPSKTPTGGINNTGPGTSGANRPDGGGAGTGRVVDVDFSNMKVTLKPPPPPYPAIAKLAKIQGTVVVEIVVGTDGVPISAKAVDGPPQLRPASEQYAMQWRFQPAMSNGVPVQSRFRLTMPYKLV